MNRIRGPKTGKRYKKIAVRISAVRITVWQGAGGKRDGTNCVYRYINSLHLW